MTRERLTAYIALVRVRLSARLARLLFFLDVHIDLVVYSKMVHVCVPFESLERIRPNFVWPYWRLLLE